VGGHLQRQTFFVSSYWHLHAPVKAGEGWKLHRGSSSSNNNSKNSNSAAAAAST
jgi:hypothetical protein